MSSLLTASHYIEFPALGWSFPLNDVLAQFTIFGLDITIKWYGLLIAIGFLLAVIYALHRAPKFDIDPDRMIDVALICTLVAFVCARLYYVFFSDNVHTYLNNPIKILYIWEGGIGIYGGIIGAFVSGLLLCKLFKVKTLAMFDLASLGFLIGQAIGRWGNFFNQEAFGTNTTLPWGMTGDIIAANPHYLDYNSTLPVHPTFLYESLWCILGFVLLHLLSKKRYQFNGQIFCGYLVWYGVGRFFIEGLRTDSLMIGQIRASQLVAVLAVLGGIVLHYFLHRRSVALPKTLVAEGEEALDTPAKSEEKTNYIIIDNTAKKAADNAAEEAPAEEISAVAEEAEQEE